MDLRFFFHRRIFTILYFPGKVDLGSLRVLVFYLRDKHGAERTPTEETIGGAADSRTTRWG